MTNEAIAHTQGAVATALTERLRVTAAALALEADARAADEAHTILDERLQVRAQSRADGWGGVWLSVRSLTSDGREYSQG